MIKVSHFILVIIIYFSNSIYGHTYHNGGCPSVEPMSGFSMKQFLGIWYAIEKTSTASPCIVYNVTMGEEPGEYFIEQTSQHFAVALTPVKHEYSYTGQITVPDNDIPAKMRVSFPLSVGGDSSFVVFMTDYENYAGIFTCQSFKILHRQSATLLSRTRTLDKTYVEKMRNRLAKASVNPFSLSIINQTGCPKDASAGYNIHIDQNTFSAANVANVFRKAGEKIGDGVEWTIDTSKKLYHKFTDNDNVQQIPHASAKMTTISDEPNPDAEWVRV